MKNWLECLDNPEAVTDLYDVAPDLERVWLPSICLADNPASTIVLSTTHLPSRHPTRWGKFNVVDIEFGLTGLATININGWPWERFVGMKIIRTGGEIAVRVHGSGIDVELRCSHLRICRINGYMAEEAWLRGFNDEPRNE